MYYINKYMRIIDYVSTDTARKMFDNGYNVYSKKQYIIDVDGNATESNMSLDDCVIEEMLHNKKFMFVPMLYDALDWLNMNYSDWDIFVRYDTKMNGYYFNVQNITTGYDYRQPTCPKENDVFKLYEWGLLHVLNRLE